MQLVDQKKPHIIALCEVKPKSGSERSLQDFTISGITCHQTNLDNNIGRGIAVLLHSSISHLVTKINQNSEFQEACLIEIFHKKKNCCLDASIEVPRIVFRQTKIVQNLTHS